MASDTQSTQSEDGAKISDLKDDEVNDGTYGVRHVQQNVIETIFSALPTEPNDRKKEQDRRRKFKDKVLSEHQGKLIIDSSYITSDGKIMQTHTNTILRQNMLRGGQKTSKKYLARTILRKIKHSAAGTKCYSKTMMGINF
jgi:hypothetical protein